MDLRPQALVIDDQATIRRLYRLVLEGDGWEVVEAPDGWTGLDLAVENRPDLIILDLMLPDIDGFALFQELRALPGGQSRPILVLSGWLRELDEVRCQQAPFTICRQKPIRLAEFRQIVSGCNPSSLD